MAANTSHTPDGHGGVLIYNGEVILTWVREVTLEISKASTKYVNGKRNCQLYLTSHRIILITSSNKDQLHSFCIPFNCLRNVTLEQPILGANHIKGEVVAQPNGNWEGSATYKLTFSKGGCIDFGKALLRAVDLSGRYTQMTAPPPYAPPSGGYYSAPPAYYTAPNGNLNGFQAPVQAFPELPNPNDVYMYESPPPYGGIGPTTVYPAGELRQRRVAQPTAPEMVIGNGQPDQLPSYDQAIKKEKSA